MDDWCAQHVNAAFAPAVNMRSILQISAADVLGGAENIAMNLSKSYRQQGHQSWLAVGSKHGTQTNVFEIPNERYRSHWSRFWVSASRYLQPKVGTSLGATRALKLIQRAGEWERLKNVLSGHEDFEFPGTWHVLELLDELPDIVHCHNLHGNFFDLRALPWLSNRIPVVLTLHDAWLLSGHCSHSLDCERWKTGCGDCPYLMSPPAILRDGSRFNWIRKKQIFAESQLYVATPCEWLMQKVRQSILCGAMKDARVIPNGVDLSIFGKGDKRAARHALQLPQDAKVLLFVASNIRQNVWKDFETIRAAIRVLSDQWIDDNFIFIALGERHHSETIGRGRVVFVPYQSDPMSVLRYYRAADLYLHAARQDTFPTSILEALACGVPVIATGVGGIPEQVKSLDVGQPKESWPLYDSQDATGILVNAADASAMAVAAKTLMSNRSLVEQISHNAAQDATKRFDANVQARAYLDWFAAIYQRANAGRQSYGFDGGPKSKP